MWIPVTLLCALSFSARDAVVKALSNQNVKIFRVLVIAGFFTSVFATGFALIFFRGQIEFSRLLQPESLKWILIFASLDSFATILQFKALSLSPLSLTAPFLAFSPVLVPLFSWILLGENSSFLSYAGIFLVVIGSYVLFFDNPKDLLAPFKNLWKEKGSLLMFSVAVIYSFSAVVVRKTVLVVGVANLAVVYNFIGFLFVLIVLTVSAQWKNVQKSGDENPLPLKKRILLYGGVSLFGSVSFISHFIGASMVSANYMIPVKRTSMLFSILIAYFFFDEKNIKSRLLGGGLMLGGVALTAILGGSS